MPWAEMLFFITPPRNALKPNSPPKSTPTIASMMIMRLVINATPRILPARSVSALRRGCARLLAIPPAAAQCLKQRRRVRVARCLRLNEPDLRLLVLALRVEKHEIARRAELQLFDRHLEAFAPGGLGIGLGLGRTQVDLKGKQHVGDVLERAEDRLLILREGLVVGGLCTAFLRLELP